MKAELKWLNIHLSNDLSNWYQFWLNYKNLSKNMNCLNFEFVIWISQEMEICILSQYICWPVLCREFKSNANQNKKPLEANERGCFCF